VQEWFAQVQAPLALLLSHPEVTNPLHYPATNPLFAHVNDYWNKAQTAAALQQLLGRSGSIRDVACARLALRVSWFLSCLLRVGRCLSHHAHDLQIRARPR
jgi:hypothetical protein